MEDRLSNLPRDVLLHILGFLKTKDVLRTCVLSKRWMFLWAGISSLRFNSLSFKRASAFQSFVKHVLSHRDASADLRDMELYLWDNDGSTFELVMHYLVLHGHNLQNLFFSFTCYVERPMSLFWTRLFTWESLKTLTLKYLYIPIRLHFHFVSLTTFNLEHCYLLFVDDIDNPATCRFKISAPQLTHLNIWSLGFEGLERYLKMILYTPKLSSFSYAGPQPFELSIMPPHPALQHVYLNLFLACFPIQPENLINMIAQLGTARLVILSCGTVFSLYDNPDVLKGKTSMSCGAEEFSVKWKEYCSITLPAYVLHYLLTAFPSAQEIKIQHCGVTTDIAMDVSSVMPGACPRIVFIPLYNSKGLINNS